MREQRGARPRILGQRLLSQMAGRRTSWIVGDELGQQGAGRDKTKFGLLV